jgi:ferredoxin
MQADKEGFLYPVVDETVCTNCGCCEKVCPMKMVLPVGTMPKAYAAWHTDQKARQNSSSGGVFSALGAAVLQKGGAVFGAAFADDLTLSHSMVEHWEDYQRFRGSKYLQSQIGKSYVEVQKQLENGRLILFSGTPCQVAGLQAFLGKGYDNLVTCDLVCYGVPSPKVFAKYRLWREQQYGAPTRKITFRDKSLGWKTYCVAFLFENDAKYREVATKDPFIQGFLKNLYLRPSCHDCRFSRLPRIADLSLGDFWGVAAHHPEWDDDQGTSLILVNTLAGAKALNACQAQLIRHEAPLDQALAHNPRIRGSVRPSRRRRAFFRDLDRVPFEALIKKYCVDNLVTKYSKQAVAFLLRIGSQVKRRLKGFG